MLGALRLGTLREVGAGGEHEDEQCGNEKRGHEDRPDRPPHPRRPAFDDLRRIGPGSDGSGMEPLAELGIDDSLGIDLGERP